MSVVGITKSSYSEIHEKIALAIERGGGISVDADDAVVIKVNLCNFRTPDTGAVTHPLFLDSVLDYLKSLSTGLHVSVVESDATVARPDKLIDWLGLRTVFEKHGAKWVNLSKDRLVDKRISGRYFQEIAVPATIAESDFLISMAKLKTHTMTKISCCLKNQFGCIPYRRKIRFHPKLHDVIVDSCVAMKPDFCIVDGILGMGGVKGPDFGVPIKSNVIVTGKDPVSVDSVCARLMGLNPSSIEHIRKAEKTGLGRISSEIVGEEINDMRKNFEFDHFYARIINMLLSSK